MSLESNVNDLAQRVAEEFNAMQTQISSLSGGGGGGGGLAAPTYHGQFTLCFSMSTLAGMAFTTITGPSVNASSLWIDSFASPENTGFDWSRTTVVENGISQDRINGGVVVQNAGKYRVRVLSNVSAGTMNSGAIFKTALLRNSTQVLMGVQPQHFEISSAGGSISHTNYAKQQFSGIVTCAANDVLCFAHHPGSQAVNNPSVRHAIEIESLF